VSVSASYKAFVLDQLGGAGTTTAKAMFGGVGLYCQGLFFGLIDDDTLYLKVDDTTRADFQRVGSEPFRPYGDESHVMQYYQLPAEVLEDREAARPWVERAIEVARRAAARKSGGRRRR
jgi:DNA transformation protein and related proteins